MVMMGNVFAVVDKFDMLMIITLLLCGCCLQVGLSSRNDAVVCACVRVLAALLHVALGLHSLAQRSSKPGLARADNWQEQGDSQQDQWQQQQHLKFQSAHADSVDNASGQQQEPEHQLRSDTVGRLRPSDSDDEQLQLHSSSNSSSTASWQELLQLLLTAAGERARSAAVRAAALQELRQLLLHLADALGLSSVSPPSSSSTSAAVAAAAAPGREAEEEIGEQVKRSSSSGCELAASRDVLLAGVLPLALAALQEEQQELRRWAVGQAGRQAGSRLHVWALFACSTTARCYLQGVMLTADMAGAGSSPSTVKYASP
jgi:hypothetical protein